MLQLKTLRVFLIAAACVPVTFSSAMAGETVSDRIKALADLGKGQAAVITSQAAMVTAVGAANANLATARKTLEDCRGVAIDNNLKATEVFYKKRETRDAYRKERYRKRLSQQDLVRLAKAAAPVRLTSLRPASVRGGIQWPAIFQEQEFAACHEQLDLLFSKRSFSNSGPGSELCRQAYEPINQMRAQLRAQIRQMPPAEYVVAKRFLNSLAYEAQFSPGLDRIAAN